MEAGTFGSPLLKQSRHALDGSKFFQECVGQHLPLVTDTCVLDCVVDIRDYRNTYGLDQVNLSGELAIVVLQAGTIGQPRIFDLPLFAKLVNLLLGQPNFAKNRGLE